MRKSQNVALYEYLPGVEQLREVGMDAFFFSGGEPHVNVVAEFDRYAHYVIRLYGGSFEDLGLALTIKNYLSRKGAFKVDLFAPYFPGARQDRGAPFTAALYADIVNGAGFHRVYIVDPHSHVVVDLLERVWVIHGRELVPDELFSFHGVVNAPTPTFSVIAPDEGAEHRASMVAGRFGVPLVQAHKKRDADNNFRVGEYTVDPVETDYAVVIDDICDGGGTFLALADAIDMPQDRLRLWTTHGIYSKGTDALYSKYGMLASTDSINHTTSIHHTVQLKPVLERIIAGDL